MKRYVRLVASVVFVMLAVQLGSIEAYAYDANAASESMAARSSDGANSNEQVFVSNTSSVMTEEELKAYDPYYPSNDPSKPYVFTVPSLENRMVISNNGKTATLFPPYADKLGQEDEKGYFDVNKTWTNDGALCWAASASNLLGWYMKGVELAGEIDTGDLPVLPTDIFEKFKSNWNPTDAQDPVYGLSWYFTGGFSDGNTPEELINKNSGGYLKDVIPYADCPAFQLVNSAAEDDTGLLGNYEKKYPFVQELLDFTTPDGPLYSYESFSKSIIQQLHFGPTAISVTPETGSAYTGHAITLWGCDYDTETKLVTAVYLVDSDDDKTQIKKVDVHASDDDTGGIRINFPAAKGDTIYTKITSSAMLFAPGSVSVVPAYSGPDAKIEDVSLTGDKKAVVSAQDLADEELEYGYAFEDSAALVNNWQTDTSFSLLPNETYYFFVRVKANATHAAGGVSESKALTTMPSPAPSSLSFPAVSLGTSQLFGYARANSYQYVWLGKADGKPIAWRVLDDKADTSSDDGLFMLSDELYGQDRDGSVKFSYQEPPKNNEYPTSDAKKWIENFETKNFAPAELQAMQETSKSDATVTSVGNPMTPNGILFRGMNSILSSDRLFLPSVEELQTERFGFAEHKDRIAEYHGRPCGYWLRSPKAEGVYCAGHVDDHGYIFNLRGSFTRAARPAFNLDKNSVLFSTAVAADDASNALDAELRKVDEVVGSDFKLTLKDASRQNFTAQLDDNDIHVGDTCALRYAHALTGEREYISVLLTNEAQEVLYWGRVGKVSAADGTAELKIPEDIEPGSYTLKVFNQQCNGKFESDYAGDAVDIPVQLHEAKPPVPDPGAPDAPEHVHKPTAVSGLAPTHSESGWKGYYVCGQCGKYFEDEGCTKPIDDLESWKEGAGKLDSMDEVKPIPSDDQRGLAQSEKEKKLDMVQTGDKNRVALLIAFAGLSFGAIAVLLLLNPQVNHFRFLRETAKIFRRPFVK